MLMLLLKRVQGATHMAVEVYRMYMDEPFGTAGLGRLLQGRMLQPNVLINLVGMQLWPFPMECSRAK